MFITLFITDKSIQTGDGYIAGCDDGIVTVAGRAASREVYLYVLRGNNPILFTKTWSNAKGNYIFSGLDVSSLYLVIARDYKKEFEPFVWDYVKPADDLTIAEQQALWASWQTK